MNYEIQQTEGFADGLSALGDLRARIAIARRLERAAAGNLGDAKPVGGDVRELRIDVGPGYRVYFVRRGATLIVLLCGGDKSTQSTDIRRAHRLSREV